MSETTFLSVGDYKYLSFATMEVEHRCVDTSMLFDTMRYESAYLVRRDDVKAILAVAGENEPPKGLYSFLLAKYDWSKAGHWHPTRVMCDEKLTPLTLAEACRISQVESNVLPKKAKIRVELGFTGTLAEILAVMFNNKAFPSLQHDAHVIMEQFKTPNQRVTVTLAKFDSAKNLFKVDTQL